MERGYRMEHRGEDRFKVFRGGSFRREDLDLQRLEDLENWHISEGEPDIRGWDIVRRGADKIGSVETLIASPKTRQVYFIVSQIGGTLGFGGKHVLVPMDRVHLDHDNNRVEIDATREQLENAVEWRRDMDVDYGRAYEYWEGIGMPMEHREMAGVAGGEAPPTHGQETTTGHGTETRIPLREEEVVARREVHTGEVEVEKHVETEQRTVEVPVGHTEVEIERRPVTGDARFRTEGEIAEGEVHVPVMEEEIHVEKRPVVKEEIVIRQHPETRTERRTETIRREVAEVHKEGDVDVETHGDIDVK